MRLVQYEINRRDIAIETIRTERDTAWAEIGTAWTERDTAWTERDTARNERDTAWAELKNIGVSTVN
ncbi:MAG: hypothetical protein FWH18_11160 [Marinilabiliaceae bacterium]|nr:hypothetical protein [Marinilabiliaceae bacterium]